MQDYSSLTSESSFSYAKACVSFSLWKAILPYFTPFVATFYIFIRNSPEDARVERFQSSYINVDKCTLNSACL